MHHQGRVGLSLTVPQRKSYRTLATPQGLNAHLGQASTRLTIAISLGC